ncbi:M23 family metallopeptidase [Foetidibacter luteolus]|uniref:M23 family metallopeptidase n=1 Tax=Foetidibacter luteolus TaxID=2608880 RepID=UPI00129AB3AA|nr:M23 family metallopeptidase [Foetidibacter luteolus]
MADKRTFFTGIATCLVLCSLYWSVSLHAQYPQNYFRNPLTVPLQLAANFGEVRPNHFHMGLDIRTQGRENLPVHAAAEGYISRIKIEKWGYGKAIYITHPNGYTTVYAHLNSFYKPLQDFLEKQQYAAKSWEQDFCLEPADFPVTKGQFIALSGNTGGSAGPHLHFEIRDTETANCLNPLLFGFGVPDNIPPVIQGLYWYDRRYSTYQVDPKRINIVKKPGGYVTAQAVIKVSSPLVSLGLRAEDKSSNSPFLFGIYGAQVYLDDALVNSFELDNFSYDDSRYVNACVDYSTYMKSKAAIQHLSVLPGNRLPVFEKDKKGILMLADTEPHKLKIVVKDVAGNTSVLQSVIQFDVALQKDYFFTSNSIAFSPGKENRLEGPSVKAVFDEAAFYDVVPFVSGEQQAAGPGKASALVQLHNQFVPVNDSFLIQLKTTLPAGSPLRNKVVMFKTTGKHKEATKGEWNGDWMMARFNRLGSFQLLIDTLPPVIKPVGWQNNTIFGAQKTLRLRCTDELDEVAYFRAELDGQWLMFAKKNDDFTYEFDSHCSPGSHVLKVMVTDMAGNTAMQQFTFTKK